jgi:hypothetical protein
MLRPIQHLLETIYDASTGHDVRDFLVTSRAQLPPETLLRHQIEAETILVIVKLPESIAH